MSFANRLKSARVAMNLTQQDLATKIDVQNTSVSNYEKGISFPTIETLYKIFDALKVEPNFLFQDDVKFENISLSLKEKALIDDLRTLTVSGQKKAADYIKDLSLNPYYSNKENKSAQKNGPEEKTKIKFAARNGRFIEKEFTDEEEDELLKKVYNLPDADDL